MPRQTLGTAPLRNRNRITNKTRLKVIHGNIDADPLVLDEDEEKARIISTAGVDAEDANEHHLQAVLSAASQRTNGHTVRSTRASENVNKPQAPAAFIPVPDATGVVDNYAEFYPSGRWTDPSTYLRFSATTDETCRDALASDATYVLDERDEEWLAKNNQEARGEGTSANAVLSTSSGTTTRSGASQRSSKSKGKDPEIPQPVAMTEDEFELVMGIFEKVTHDKTEFLHHGFEQGTTFPPFSDYQDTFVAPLLSSMFASFVVPTWIPPPAHLLRIARVVYPHWRDRRIERGGRRIIPYLNFDEADVKNESYICFRRREIKAVRKTRASQVTSSDKLLRLQSELLSSWELASNVLARETYKKDIAAEAKNIWEKRLSLVDLKRKFSSIMSKEDEEMLYDKRPKVNDNSMSRSAALRLSSRDRGLLGSPSALHQDILVRPKERTAVIQSQIEKDLIRQKERDHHWEDQVENPFQSFPVSLPSRHFKYFSVPSGSHKADTSEGTGREARAFRLRFGRGGRMYLDRRFHMSNGSSISAFGDRMRPSVRNTSDQEDSETERNWRLRDRWRYDDDDSPATGPKGPDEDHRIMVDDYQTKYMRYSMTLFGEQDHQNLVSDVTLCFPSVDGRPQSVVPFRLGPQTVMRRDFQGMQRMHASASMQGSAVHMAPGSSNGSPSVNGTPISVQAQMKKMQPSAGSSQTRISTNASMRPPAPPSVTANGSVTHTSPPHPQNQVGNGVNASTESPPKNVVHAVPPSYPHPGGVAQSHTSPLSIPLDSAPGRVSSPMRPKSQNQHHVPYPTVAIANGYPGAGMNGPYSGYPSALPNGSPYMPHPNGQHNGLSVQQMQSLKSAFATLPGQVIPLQPGSVGTAPARSPSMYPTHVISNGGNLANLNLQLGPASLNLKLPPSRSQWHTAQRMGTMDVIASPNLAHALPAGAMARAPSANGHHLSPPGRGTASPVSHLMGPAQGRASPSIPHMTPATHSLSLSPNQSSPTLSPSHPHNHPTPPRMSQTPVPSPSHQHQLVTGSGAGY